MVSNKTIIILITVAIILSVLSVVVTISSVNTKSIPDLSNIKQTVIPDKETAQVGIIISPPAAAP